MKELRQVDSDKGLMGLRTWALQVGEWKDKE